MNNEEKRYKIKKIEKEINGQKKVIVSNAIDVAVHIATIGLMIALEHQSFGMDFVGIAMTGATFNSVMATSRVMDLAETIKAYKEKKKELTELKVK